MGNRTAVLGEDPGVEDAGEALMLASKSLTLEGKEMFAAEVEDILRRYVAESVSDGNS